MDEAQLKLKNIAGKRLLEKTKLEYSQSIIAELSKYPEIINEVIDNLDLVEEDFYDYLSGTKSTNITFYDEALSVAKEKIKQKELKK